MHCQRTQDIKQQQLFERYIAQADSIGTQHLGGGEARLLFFQAQTQHSTLWLQKFSSVVGL